MIELPRSSGVQLHLTSLPGGRLGRRGVPIRRLAGGRRADLVAGAAARTARPLRLTVQGAVGVRGVAGVAGRSAGAGVGCRDRFGFGSARRFGRWSGSDFLVAVRWPTRCGSRASGRPCGAYAASAGVRMYGDVAIYVAPGSADHRAHPELFRSGVRCRRATRCVHGRRAAVGEPAVRLAGAAPAAVPLVGRAAAADDVAVRPGPDRPLPRVRFVLGGAGGRATRRRGRWQRGPGTGGVRRGRLGRSGRCPWSPRTWA